MKREFMFRGGPVGCFTDNAFPLIEGDYAYMPYRSMFHLQMGESVKTAGSALCYYENAGERTTFTVVALPRYGWLTLADFQTMPIENQNSKIKNE
jgi:hypothetical protein